MNTYSQDHEDYFEQAGNLFRIFSDEEKDRLVATIAGGLSRAESSVQERMIGYLMRADSDYGQRVHEAIEKTRHAV